MLSYYLIEELEVTLDNTAASTVTSFIITVFFLSEISWSPGFFVSTYYLHIYFLTFEAKPENP